MNEPQSGKESHAAATAREETTTMTTTAASATEVTATTAQARSTDAATTNVRGIPFAPFVDRVEDYVSSAAEVEDTLKSFQEMISKYQFMEVNISRRAAGLKDKIPDMEKTLDTVLFLRSRSTESEPLETTFELNDTLFAKASIPYTQEVYLWLGANVMLAYPIAEAVHLLEEKLAVARKNLADCDEDVDFLREQVTTLEVATARVYNWDVVRRREDSAATAATGAGKAVDCGKADDGAGATRDDDAKR